MSYVKGYARVGISANVSSENLAKFGLISMLGY